MARGWESKSVESQMETAKEDQPVNPRQLTDAQKKTQRERNQLMLSRAYVMQQMQSSTNERYTESLRQALSDLDRKIGQLDGRR
jgi:hypothetical protein